MQTITLRANEGTRAMGEALSMALARLPELIGVRIFEAKRNFLSGMAAGIPLLTQIRYILQCQPDILHVHLAESAFDMLAELESPM